MIHTESTKIRHFLAIADFYIRLGQPQIYEVEPYVDENYRPDAYTLVTGEPIIVEIQRSHISYKRMQEKIDNFADTFRRGKHNARMLWIVSDEEYRVRIPAGFQVEQISLTEGVS